MEQVVAGTAPAPHPVRVNIADEMTSDRGFHDRGVTLRWRVNAGAEQSAPMRWNGNNQWRGVVPAQANGASVQYWVTAVDFSGNTGTGPTRAFNEAARPGDLDGNGVVNGADLGLLLAAWGTCGTPCPGDLDGNGVVNGADLGLLLAAWG
jgi:hypothetical protein